jgi:hypothetical protein
LYPHHSLTQQNLCNNTRSTSLWPTTYTIASDKKIIYRKARAAPKLEYSELAKAGVVVSANGTPSKPPSRSTLYRLLKRHGLTNFPCKSVQNSTVRMLSRVYNSVGSTERSSGHSARSSSQMSAQFRRALAKTESGSSVTWKRNGSQRCCRLSLQAGSQRRWCGCQYDLMNVGGHRGAHWSSWSAIPMLQEVATPPVSWWGVVV